MTSCVHAAYSRLHISTTRMRSEGRLVYLFKTIAVLPNTLCLNTIANITAINTNPMGSTMIKRRSIPSSSPPWCDE